MTCKIRIKNGSVVKVYGHDEMADFMLRNLHEGDIVFLEGKLDSNMCINAQVIHIY